MKWFSNISIKYKILIIPVVSVLGFLTYLAFNYQVNNVNAERLTSQQIATNQLLLRAILDTSRQERREDLGDMMVLWDTDRQKRSQMTEESLRYLIRNQAEDKRELRDLSQALRGYDNQQDENL